VALEAQRHPADLEAGLIVEAHDVLAAARKDRARRIKENRQKRASAAANAARSMRSFTLTWAELLGWSRHYDPARAARELSDDDWALFLSVIEETNAFVETVTRERQRLRT
jgi:ParB family chromosome partitioning protein